MLVLSYTIQSNGHTTDFKVENSLSRDCDQEVFKHLQALPDVWIPTVYRGQPTDTRFYLFVRFRIIEGEKAKRLLAEARRRGNNSDAAPNWAQTVIVHSPYAHEVVITALGIERDGRPIR